MSYRAGTALLICLLSGCQRTAAPSFERVAVVGFENLTGDPAWNWLGPAAGATLAFALSDTPHWQVLRLDALREGETGQASQVISGAYQLERGRLVITAVRRDLRTQRTQDEARAEGAIGDAPVLLRSIGQTWRPALANIGTNNPQALKDYGAALAATEATSQFEHFAGARRADPNFGLAYLDAAQAAAARGDGAAVQSLLTAAQPRLGSFTPLVRARLSFLDASVRGDMAGRVAALEAAATATGSDPDALAEAARLANRQRDFPRALRLFRAALDAKPGDGALLNQAGYAAAFAGDLAGANAAMSEYRRLNPQDVNAIDSLGEVNYVAGRFREAEQFFQEAYQREPKFLGGATLWKAAWSRLRAGDPEGATKLHEQFLQRRPDAIWRRALWQAVLGQKAQAIQSLQAADEPIYHLQLSAWYLAERNQTAALRELQQINRRPLPNGVQAALAMCALAAQPPSPDAAVWQGRAGQFFAAPGAQALRPLALAYAEWTNGLATASVPLWQNLRAQREPAAAGSLSMWLTLALAQSGHEADAKQELRVYPIPVEDETIIFSADLYRQELNLRASLR